MLKLPLYPTFLFLALSLIPATPSPAQDAKLQLTALPKMGNFPLTVQLQGLIQNADEHDPELHCLDADWDFDHVRYFDRKDCPPLEEGGVIERYYSTSHTFELPGTYRVRLTLRRGRERVLQDEVWIKVLMVRNEDAGGSAPIDIVNTPVRAEVSELLRSPVEYHVPDGRREGTVGVARQQRICAPRSPLLRPDDSCVGPRLQRSHGGRGGGHGPISVHDRRQYEL